VSKKTIQIEERARKKRTGHLMAKPQSKKGVTSAGEGHSADPRGEVGTKQTKIRAQKKKGKRVKKCVETGTDYSPRNHAIEQKKEKRQSVLHRKKKRSGGGMGGRKKNS